MHHSLLTCAEPPARTPPRSQLKRAPNGMSLRTYVATRRPSVKPRTKDGGTRGRANSVTRRELESGRAVKGKEEWSKPVAWAIT
jgi:hypothetical protein